MQRGEKQGWWGVNRNVDLDKNAENRMKN